MKLLRSLMVSVVALVALTAAASAFNLRAPQVVFNYGPLQGYLNVVDAGINVATDQLDAQVWATSVSGNTDFTLMLRGTPNNDAIGLYNANQPLPLFQVFPPGAGAGWFAALHFSGGNLTVNLFDQNSVPMGQTFYGGVNQNNFGFYVQGGAGVFYSQDFLNGVKPQVLTYLSNQNFGDWWECFEDHPYFPGSDFIDVVLELQSVHPTPTHGTSWGTLKSLYR